MRIKTKLENFIPIHKLRKQIFVAKIHINNEVQEVINKFQG